MTPLFLLLALQPSAPPEAELPGPPIIRAALHEVHIYTSGTIRKETDEKWAFGGGGLWLLKMDLKEGSKISFLDCKPGAAGGSEALLRWQLIRGQYCFVSYAFGGGDLGSAIRHGNMRITPLAAIEFANADPTGSDVFVRRKKFHDELIETGPNLSPVGQATMGFLYGEAYIKSVHFDIWERGQKQFEVYVSAPWPGSLSDAKTIQQHMHKYNRLVRADFRPERKLRNDQWETVGDWTYDWEGPFYLATNKDERYFVTDTGRVFAAPQKAKAGTPLKEIWKGKPVDALIHDADSAKWYAFTKDQYFEVADPIKPLAHTIAIRRSNKADEALVTAAKCGRVIRGIPEPKDK